MASKTLPGHEFPTLGHEMSSVAVRHPVVGRLWGYRDSGFYEFSTGRVMGLTKVLGQRIEFLAVASTEPGRGHFSEFLEELRGSYREIIVWELMNDRFEESLRRQGFVGLIRLWLGESIGGLVWRRDET